MDSEIKQNINYEKRASIITGLWLIFSIFTASRYVPTHPDWASIGALLSGIFAPIALTWFYVSYQLQRQELSLQREELKLQRQALEKQVEELGFTREEITLQRQALQQQVAAQKGSEEALTIQSKTLQRQLEIIEQQNELAIENRRRNKPKFLIKNPSLFDFIKDKVTKESVFSCEIPIINIGSDAKLRLVEVNSTDYMDGAFRAKVNDDNSTICIRSIINTVEHAHNFIDEDSCKNNEGHLDFIIYKLKAYLDILTKLTLTIYYYSESTGSGSDVYTILFEDGKMSLKLKDNTH